MAHLSFKVLEVAASVETPHVQSFTLTDSREEGQPRLGGGKREGREGRRGEGIEGRGGERGRGGRGGRGGEGRGGRGGEGRGEREGHWQQVLNTSQDCRLTHLFGLVIIESRVELLQLLHQYRL